MEDLIFEEYTREIVNKYILNESDKNETTVEYKEIEFLHPYHIHQFRLKRLLPKPAPKRSLNDIYSCWGL